MDRSSPLYPIWRVHLTTTLTYSLFGYDKQLNKRIRCESNPTSHHLAPRPTISTRTLFPCSISFYFILFTCLFDLQLCVPRCLDRPSPQDGEFARTGLCSSCVLGLGSHHLTVVHNHHHHHHLGGAQVSTFSTLLVLFVSSCAATHDSPRPRPAVDNAPEKFYGEPHVIQEKLH